MRFPDLVPAYVEQATIEIKDDGGGKSTHVPGVCATCTRCGHSATAEGRFIGDTKRKALGMLHDECPMEKRQKYRDRIIPRGVTVWFPHLGKLYPVEVSRLTPCTVAGPVLKTTPLVVTFDDMEFKKAAEKFARRLKRKYVNTELRMQAAPVASA